jgi:hypothetical protein
MLPAVSGGRLTVDTGNTSGSQATVAAKRSIPMTPAVTRFVGNYIALASGNGSMWMMLNRKTTRPVASSGNTDWVFAWVYAMGGSGNEYRCYYRNASGNVIFWDFAGAAWTATYSATNTRRSLGGADQMYDIEVSPTSGIRGIVRNASGTMLYTTAWVPWANLYIDSGDLWPCLWTLNSTDSQRMAFAFDSVSVS